ncbi:MAG: pilus assembly protein [Bdellovibrionales bacterium]|nr:pilus assembly protein [Bdellovibrionales bacterium]
MHSLKGTSSDSGAALLEIALTISVFLAIVFWALWFGFALHARTNFIASMGDGLLYGVTRSDSTSFYDQSAIPSLNNFHNSGVVPTDASRADEAHQLMTLLYHKGKSQSESDDAFDLAHVESQVIAPVFGTSAKFDDLPLSYLYTLALTHEFMRLKIGAELVRYPCSGEPRCLRCEFVNPDSIVDPLLPTNTPYDTTTRPFGADEMNPNLLGLTCTYNLDLMFSSTIGALIGFDQPTIKRTFLINRSRDLS